MSDLTGFGFDETKAKAEKLIREQNKKKCKSGGFQSMGLFPDVLKGALRRGYKLPTPIQRKVIPVILDGKDVVAMARTGSGKTAAFLIPMFQKLMMPAQRAGGRAIILAPTRELAMQTLAFAKDLGKFTPLTIATFFGGERMSDQFERMHSSPDVFIATPGRFAHLCVEMNLSLENIEYVVFDEADRLFEMGFKEQLQEIMARLPTKRQTLLFSATLPKQLVEFATAGLNDPTLIRLDTETKLSELLTQTFFRVNTDDRMSLLVHVMSKVLKRHSQTIIFAPTKHFVEFINGVLQAMKFSTTYIYSTLDQEARSANVAKFKSGQAEILVCTDIAARGIDVPSLDAVINFTFPSKPKLYVHRVGRVARAGKAGITYSFVTRDELPYLIDLQFFLNRDIKVIGKEEFSSGHVENKIKSAESNIDMIIGATPQCIPDEHTEYLEKLVKTDNELAFLSTSLKGSLDKYNRTKELASKAAVHRLKEELWGSDMGFHPLLLQGEQAVLEQKRNELLQKLRSSRQSKSMLDESLAAQGSTNALSEEFRRKTKFIMEQHKERIEQKKKRLEAMKKESQLAEEQRKNIKNADEDYIVESFKMNKQTTNYQQAFTENCYSVESEFKRQASAHSLDLLTDNDDKMGQKDGVWDRKRKRFTKPTDSKKIKTESGQKISASYKKDIYEKWRAGRRDLFQENGPGEAAVSHPNKKLRVLVPKKHTKVHPILSEGAPAKGDVKEEVHQLDRRLKIRKTENKKRAFVKWRKGMNEKKRKKFMKEVRRKKQ